MPSVGPLVKAVETLKVFVHSRPALSTLLANRTAQFDRLHTILPSNAVVGEPVEGTLQAWDQCERLFTDDVGPFTVDSTDPEATYPEQVSLAAADEGYRSLSDVTFATPGYQYLTVTHADSDTRFVSNPVQVTETDPDDRYYWGDLHLHSQHSDGTGSVDDGLAFGRNVMALDVVAYTDHDTMGFFIPPSLQRRRMHGGLTDAIKDAVADHHDPGAFVTLFAYEWTQQPNVGGHINVYFDSVTDADLFDSLTADTDTYEKLWDRLRAYNADGDGEALTIPHHPAEAMYPFDFSAVEYDDELAPLVEVYSQWGSSERPASDGNTAPLAMGQGEIDERGHYVQDALALGHRVGLTGGSDYHGPHPGHSLIHAAPHLPSLADWRDQGLGWSLIWRVWAEGSYPGGLQAIVAPDLTREAVFDSMRSRSVYATTQPDRIIADLRVDGVRFGEQDSTVTLDSPDAEREVSVAVAGTAPLDTVTVVKNNEPWRTVEASSDPDAGLDTYVREATWTDDEPVAGMQFDDERGTDADVYYLHVEQADGGMAWVGPVWVGV
jgi:hypothetical protein